MKKGVIKLLVFAVIFVVATVIINKIMNKDHDNLTMEMAEASLPLVTMVTDGIEYNCLHGYTTDTDIAFQRDTVTVLGENRNTDFLVDTYGENVTKITLEVRNVDGSRLIENTEVTDIETDRERIRGTIALKDLIEKDKEYSLKILLELDGERTVSYYTRVIWSDSLHIKDKLGYVVDFHERLYDRNAARELTKYLETNAELEDNSSFHKVNIHSSFRQITWDELGVKEVAEPVIRLAEIASQTASVLMDYLVSTSDGNGETYYMVEEYYRIRYTADRIYLLDYERTMTQIPDVEEMYANNKILLGITGTDIPMMESTDGNVVVFVVANKLMSYNVSTNKLAVIYSFYDENNMDARTVYDQHGIRILDVDEGGNVQFAVYGYMNRGRYEGKVGIQIYNYSSSLNTIEELLYIPYDKTYSVLAAEMEQLLYMNREQKLYLMLDNTVYRVDLVERTYTAILKEAQEAGILISDSHKIAVWSEGKDEFYSAALNIKNFSNDTKYTVLAEKGEIIKPLGFMEEDIIYGVAYLADVQKETSGSVFFPMHKICICNSAGELLKEYKQDGIYVIEANVENNQITLERVQRQESGEYVKTYNDHIMNNMEADAGDNVLAPAIIDRYKQYVQIQTKKTIDSKTIKILTPKEVVYEGGRELNLSNEEAEGRYYVYGAYGVEGIFSSPADAVNLAYSISGVVVDESGDCVWLKGNRVAKNQIMAIKAPELVDKENSLAVCLDTILNFEGIVRNAAYLLGQGQSVTEILQENLEAVSVLDLTGCNLDAMLYYVNQDIPVLAMLKDGDAVLVTGFNDYQIVIMEPSTGKLYKVSTSEYTKWFEENGNCFITYMRK